MKTKKEIQKRIEELIEYRKNLEGPHSRCKYNRIIQELEWVIY